VFWNRFENGESDNDIVANAFNSESETSETESDVSDHVAVTKKHKKKDPVTTNKKNYGFCMV
jgi:hypothetical protein